MGAVAPPDSTLVAAEESVGRQVRLRNLISQDYVTGRLTAFSRDNGLHQFRTQDGREEWVSLANRAYQWMSPVSSHARPNPTFIHFPGNHEAIGWKVRVYWNEMGRWYAGRVRAYDQLTGLHKVVFCDGDVRWYTIRDEAVTWVQKVATVKKGTNGEWMRNVTGTAPEGSEMHVDQTKNEMKTPNGKTPRRNPTSSTTTSTSVSSLESSLSGRQTNVTHSVSRSTLPGGMTLRPRKNPSLDQLIDKNPNFCLVHARVGIFWSSDNKYYRGTLQEYNEDTEKYRLLYDDNQEEDIELEKELFRWFGPKGFSAGYSCLMKEVMTVMGAENLLSHKSTMPIETRPEDLAELSQPKEVIGRKLFLYWHATGEKYEAEVLAYDTKKKLHYLWYRDGELEWTDLKKEIFIWGENTRQVKEFPAGLEQGESIPRGKAAIGWRIAVYWREDVQFYDGRISKYYADTGRHDVDYDDGQVETLSLSSEKIIWKASPTTGSPHSVDSSASSAAQVVNASRRDVTSTSVSVASIEVPSRQTRDAFSNMSEILMVPCVLFEQQTKTATARKSSRVTQNSPKQKRPRLPSPISAELAKENNVEVLETSSRWEGTADGDSASLGKFFAEPWNRSLTNGKKQTEDEESLELYPVMSIPPEPLPSLQHTRVAKLPAQFGAGMFQVKLIAAKPEMRRVRESNVMDDMTACVHDYVSASAKMGRLPSAVEVSAASQVVPKGAVTPEYPTKEMTGQDTVASRAGHPTVNRGALNRGRKKGRPIQRRTECGGHAASLESVLASFPAVSVSQISPQDAGQSAPPLIAPMIDGIVQPLEMDYSKNLFDAARCGELTPFGDFSSADAFCQLKESINGPSLKNPPNGSD